MSTRSLTPLVLSAVSLGLASAASSAETATQIDNAFWSDDCDTDQWQYDEDPGGTPDKIEDYNIDCLYGPYSGDIRTIGRWWQSTEYYETIELSVKFWSNCGIDFADVAQVFFKNSTNMIWEKRRTSQSSCTGWMQLPVTEGTQGDYWVSAGSCVTDDNWDLGCYQWLNFSINRFDYGLEYTDPFYFQFGMAINLGSGEEWAISNLNISLSGTMAPTMSPTSSPTPQRIDCDTFDLYQTSAVVQLYDYLLNATYGDILTMQAHESLLLQLNGYDDVDDLMNGTTSMEIVDISEYKTYNTSKFMMEICVTSNLPLFTDIQAVLAIAEDMADVAEEVGARMQAVFNDADLSMSATDEAIQSSDGGDDDGGDDDDADGDDADADGDGDDGSANTDGDDDDGNDNALGWMFWLGLSLLIVACCLASAHYYLWWDATKKAGSGRARRRPQRQQQSEHEKVGSGSVPDLEMMQSSKHLEEMDGDAGTGTSAVRTDAVEADGDGDELDTGAKKDGSPALGVPSDDKDDMRSIASDYDVVGPGDLPDGPEETGDVVGDLPSAPVFGEPAGGATSAGPGADGDMGRQRTQSEFDRDYGPGFTPGGPEAVPGLYDDDAPAGGGEGPSIV